MIVTVDLVRQGIITAIDTKVGHKYRTHKVNNYRSINDDIFR